MPTDSEPSGRESFTHDDFETRIRKLEVHATEFATIKMLLAALFAVTVGGVSTGAVLLITDHQRIEALDARVVENHAAITTTGPMIGDVRSDLRVIRVELQQLSSTTADVQAHITRIEESARRPR